MSLVWLQSDQKKLRELSGEVQRMEEWLQEERTEREKLELELARERDRKKVNNTSRFISYTNTLRSKYKSKCIITVSISCVETGERCQSSARLP